MMFRKERAALHEKILAYTAMHGPVGEMKDFDGQAWVPPGQQLPLNAN